ncbi:hypothetical protein N7457_009668 [Penicillium paradoxum]|uniref:uncharacterized protein n=1 Tax=Penicillium paradoxum TaxID=176176 RepID=UPI002547E995|nr:uncharacterized protein N7457_009668 [Penicillium paradoxum]KAJ5774772.1 hypothetical protein N7457_009668 [Penicillium paradoxum]
MKRFLGTLRRSSESFVSPSPRKFADLDSNVGSSDSVTDRRDDSPEAIIARELTAFCESNTNDPSRNAPETEFVHLPKIVETAESSPNAAKEAALRIRKYLADPAGVSGHIQYNAIMLTRILVDNPGHTFTRNFDTSFVTTIKLLLRTGRDWNVQNYLRQYLDLLEQQRAWDEDLKLLLKMWSKEKLKTGGRLVRLPTVASPVPVGYPQHQSYSQSRAPRNTLPPPIELAARVEEARNSAKLLTQFVQSTPPAELEDNDLIKEFVDRCRTGSRVVQGYIHANNPAPDEDTLLTLIETNDEISVALSQQQRAMLKARKARGSSSPSSSNVNSPSPISQVGASVAGNFSPPTAPARSSTWNPESPAPVAELSSAVMTGGRSPPNPALALSSNPNTVTRFNTTPAPPAPSRYEYNAEEFQVRNPFADDFATNESDHDKDRVQGISQPQSGRAHI